MLQNKTHSLPHPHWNTELPALARSTSFMGISIVAPKSNVPGSDAYAVAHLAFCRNAGMALGHHFLEDNRALDCIYATGKLRKNAIAGGADQQNGRKVGHCRQGFDTAEAGCG